MKKFIINGEVAVIYTSKYGTGWSTMCDGENIEELLFDPIIAEWIYSGKDGDCPISHIKENLEYFGFYEPEDFKYLNIEWIPFNDYFKVDRYNGYETVSKLDDGCVYSLA